MADDSDIAVGRLRQFAAGHGLDETTLRLIALAVSSDSVERSDEEKVAEVRRQLMRGAGAAWGEMPKPGAP